MGNTLDNFGQPIISATPTQTVVDIQAVSDFAREHAWIREGTASDRGALSSDEMPDGMIFTESDTGWVYLRRGGAWALLFSNGGVHRIRPSAVSGTNVTIGSDGSVLLSATPAGATVQIRDVFSGLFRNYLVKASFSSKPSAASSVQGIVGTSPVSATTHSRSLHGYVAGAEFNTQAVGVANFGEAFLPTQGTAGSATADIIAPNVAEATYVLSQSAHVGGVSGVTNASAALNSTDQLTGLQLNLAAGATWTGEIRFYGFS